MKTWPNVHDDVRGVKGEIMQSEKDVKSEEHSESVVKRFVRWFLPTKKKVKKSEPSWKAKALEECRAFRSVGDKFSYMGIEMLVTDHGTLDSYPYMGSWITPNIHADYVNKHGDIKNIIFSYKELETLRKQNTI